MAQPGKPITYLGHPNQEKVRSFLRRIFDDPQPEKIVPKAVEFFGSHILPKSDFPVCDHLYSRTILYRAPNSYECMAARWKANAVSVIHGHPMFAFYYVVEGELAVDTYKKNSGELNQLQNSIYKPGEYFSMCGVPGAFDNGIHRVHAKAETLSLHIYSDDAMKGEVFI